MILDPISEVLNQSKPLENYDRFNGDTALKAGVEAFGGAWGFDKLAEAGLAFATSAALQAATDANTHKPVLQTHDRKGNRIDEIVFHPAWHELLDMCVSRNIVSLPWTENRDGAQVVRAAIQYLFSQTEMGTLCPIAMSFGVVPVLEKFAKEIPEIDSVWLPKLRSGKYDPRFIPASKKSGVLFGMGMTERQGGSDVRKNITIAEPVDNRSRNSGAVYEITGHKWFMSAPMCDAFLVLAQAENGISCFLVPRFKADETLNALRFQRLKDKLGNHSNASSEVEFHQAEAILLGEEGRGVSTIIEMAQHTRLDCVLSASGMQRRALSLALDHISQREAFGHRLIKQPLMQNVVADLCVESESSTLLSMYLAHCFGERASEQDQAIGRLLTPAAKYHVCKRSPGFIFEAMEVLGGNGYVEENELPRLYREAPLLSIWEGAGNVMCLDVLRGLSRDRLATEALVTKLEARTGDSEIVDQHLKGLKTMLHRPEEVEGRRLSHAITLAVQANILLEISPSQVTNAFIESRLATDKAWGSSFGTLTSIDALESIIDRAMPRV